MASNGTVPPPRRHNSIPGILREPPRAPQPVRGTPIDIPRILPHEKVFPIQIGSELFRLSGASISSDAPSYFSQFFVCQLASQEQQKAEGEENPTVRTLYIDRDPVTFQDISRHLQGYHVTPRDATHFVKLFADAQFYQLPRLVDQLYEESIYVTIGTKDFQFQKDIFSSPGDSPNYFTLGFSFLFQNPTEVFPGLDREGLLRPPSIMPPAIPNRSPEIFAELIHLLKGYPLHIRNEAHRQELLRDCRYFLFKGLEQRLIPHEISRNLLRGREEIVIRLEDIRQPGLSVVSDTQAAPLPPPLLQHSASAPVSSSTTLSATSSPATNSNTTTTSSTNTSTPTAPASSSAAISLPGTVHYSRPYVDTLSYELVLEIGGETTILDTVHMRAAFFGDSKTRVTRLLEVVGNKLNLPSTQPLGLLMASGGAGAAPASPGNTALGSGGDWVRVKFEGEESVVLDGRRWRGFGGGGGDGEEEGVEDEDVNMNINISSDDIGSSHHSGAARKRRRLDAGYAADPSSSRNGTWIVRTGQWRLRIQAANNGKIGIECVFVAVKIEAFTGERGRNEGRGFLSD